MKMLRIGICAIVAACWAAALGDNVVVGQLGQATSATKIFAAPSTHSRIYYSVKPYEYLVVRPSNKSKYVMVLLKNGIFGYAPKEPIALLPYELTTETSSPGRLRGRQLVASRTGSAIADYSLNFLGTPYVWGGNDVRNGIDCSGFVKRMYGTIGGVELPRTAAEQALVGKPIKRLQDLQPGDRLYFWESKRGKIGHTGIYLGNGYFVHSSRGHHGVATDYLTSRWQRILVAARR